MEPTKITIDFLKDVLRASTIEGSRGRLDIFSDRLTKAASEPTLALAMENLMKSLNVSTSKMNPPTAASMVHMAGTHSGQRVLKWLREQARLITMLTAANDAELIKEALESTELPEAGASGSAIIRRPYDIGIRAICETPLSHGAEGKAGNATLFRRIDVLGSQGEVMYLPYYAGNAVRGQVRDLLADHFLKSLGFKPNRTIPAVKLWFFYALYSGGALEEKSDATKAIKRQLGDNGAIRTDGVRDFRLNLPALSLLGCALGNRILPGHVQFADLRPECIEWGTGEKSVTELMTWEFLTRREDHEDHEEHHGMIANTECLRPGVVLEGGIDLDASIPELEVSALCCGLTLLQKRGKIGAENRRGMGRVNIELSGAIVDPGIYESWLSENKEKILQYLADVEALPKADGESDASEKPKTKAKGNGKKQDKPKSDTESGQGDESGYSDNGLSEAESKAQMKLWG